MFVIFLGGFWGGGALTSPGWALRAGVSALQRVPPARPGGDEVGHVSQVEVGLLAVGEGTGGQQLSLPLGVRAPGRTCGHTHGVPFENTHMHSQGQRSAFSLSSASPAGSRTSWVVVQAHGTSEPLLMKHTQ